MASMAEELCEDCGHAVRLHGKDGCEHEPGDRWIDYPNGERLVALPPCGCKAWEWEEVKHG
jgi:hypothetical protein